MDHTPISTDELHSHLPAKKNSNPFALIILCVTFVVFGLGSGLGVTAFMNSFDNTQSSRRYSSSKVNDRLEFLQWLMGGESEKRKNQSKRKFGSFDSIFGQGYKPPDIPEIEVPYASTPTPTISF